MTDREPLARVPEPSYYDRWAGEQDPNVGLPTDTETGATAWRGEAVPQSQGGSDSETAASTFDRAKDIASTASDQATAAMDAAKQKASSVADQATSAVDAGMDKAASGLENLAGTLRDKGQHLGGQGGMMQSTATMAADTLESASQFLQQRDTEQLMADLEALVRRKPVESMLVAAGIGFLLSKALR